MKIAKVINNNVVSSFNEQKKEIIYMGKGVGFQKKIGDFVDSTKIDKVFTIENETISDRFMQLLYDIPTEYVEITEQIISYARARMGKELNDIIFVTLTDHIHFAIIRKEKGMEVSNVLLWEIKRFYQFEYEIGKKALQMIEEQLGVSLSKDEAGFIALHIVNAELNEEMPDMMNITRIMQKVIAMIEHYFDQSFEEDSLDYHRFIVHLKFFAQRLINNTPIENKDEKENIVYEAVKSRYSEAYHCAKKIKTMIQENHQYTLIEDEVIYLAIHIERITSQRLKANT